MAEARPASLPKKGKRLDFVLFGVGIVLIGAFAYQYISARWGAGAAPQAPTGEIMSGLAEADAIPVESGAAKDFNVIIISLDTTRADRVGCYGNPGIKTPIMDGMAKRGVLFAKAFTPSPSTLPGHGSILTGLYPPNHGARANGTTKLAPDKTTLAEILKGQGYETAAFISAYVLDSQYGLDQGFDNYDDDLTKGVKYGEHMFRERPGDYTNEAVFQWLDEKKDSKLFAWVHYFDPHGPYLPPEPFRTQYQRFPYDGEIAFADQCIGQLLEKLESLGIRDNTLIVIAGDHGESLGEHGESTHSLLIYDATLHTPLIFSCPKLFDSGHVVESQVSNVDIVPTVLDMLGVPYEGPLDGSSLVKRQHPESIYIETICTLVLHGWAPLFGIRQNDAKYIHAPTPEFYDLKADPKELVNVLDANVERVAAFKAELDQYIGDDPYGAEALKQSVSMDAETAAKLKALGYVATARPEDVDPMEAAHRDPKDMIHHWQQVEKGSNLVETGNIEEGRLLLEAAVEEVPGDVYAMRLLSSVYMMSGKYELAEPLWRRMFELNDSDTSTLIGLSRVLFATGQAEEALTYMTRALQLDPESPEVLYAYGSYLLREGRTEEGVAQLRRVIEIDPGTTGPRAYAEIGNAYLQNMEFDLAREAYEKALEIDSSEGGALAGLGSVLVEEGDYKKAAEQFALAVRFEPNNAAVFAALAGLFDKQRDYQKAEEYAARALSINDQYPAALNNLGLIKKHTGDMPRAIELFEQVLAKAPAFVACRVNLAQCYVAMKDKDSAAEQFRLALSVSPRVTIALLNLGAYHFERGELDKAEVLFRQAILADPNYAKGHLNYGQILLQRGKIQEGLHHLKLSLELDPDLQGKEQLEQQVRTLEQQFTEAGQSPPASQPGATRLPNEGE